MNLIQKKKKKKNFLNQNFSFIKNYGLMEKRYIV